MNNVPAQSKNIVCVHLYDDFSGAANVFAQALSTLKADGHRLEIIVGDGGTSSGFIRDSHAVKTVRYRVAASRLVMLFNLLRAQIVFFFRVLHLCLSSKVDIVYVNTVLPVGAALAGRLCGKRVIVHLHEVRLGSAALFKVLLAISRRCSHEFITVSNYVGTTLRLPAEKTHIVANSISPAHWAEAHAPLPDSTSWASCPTNPFIVVMACSLRWYKGLDSFALLAERFARVPGSQRAVRFELLLNADQEEFDEFLRQQPWPGNLTFIRRPCSVFEHYRKAGMVLNLSHPEGWIETFGLTLLESMACGVPVICPEVGGCVELFEPGDGGWRIDSRNIDALERKVAELSTDPSKWIEASDRARRSALRFAPDQFAARLTPIFERDR